MGVMAVTGGTGFVGRHVVDALLMRGHTVRALTRSERPPRPGLSWIRGSLGDADAELVAGADGVIHIAGLVSARSRAEFMATNADAVRSLAEVADARPLTLISSMAAARPRLSPYAESKRAGELALAGYPGPTSIIRAPAVFGPGDAASAPLFKMIDRGVLTVPGGRGWRGRSLAWAYAPDLAHAIADAAEGKASGTSSPATHPGLTWSEFGALAARAIDRPVRCVPVPISVLLPIAAATSLTSRLFGRGFLTLGKLAEGRYPDWSSSDPIQDATPMVRALKTTIESYR